MSDVGTVFLRQSAVHLRDDHLPRIRTCLRRLEEDDLWWRPNEASNSVAILVLHLAGNLRQWIGTGVGDAEDVRRRDEEFDPPVRASTDELLERLETSVADAVRVLEETDPGRLLETVTVQGRELTRLAAAYHAVEHFAMHAGQIFWITKLRTERDLGFFGMEDGLPVRRW